MAKNTYAYCWRSGQIEFGEDIPEGAIKIGKGALTIKNVKTRARHAYDNKTLLVPGVPEAEDDIEALKALSNFCNFVKE